MTHYCNVCNKTISEKVFFYSKKHNGKPLCMYHQKNTTSFKEEKSEPEQTLDVMSGASACI